MLVFDSFLGTNYIGKEEEKAAVEVIRSQSLFRYDGPNLLRKTEQFENNVKEYIGVEHVIACSSGAAALKMSCVALNIGYGDEVIMTAFTYIASAGAVLSCGAIPVFVDVDESMNIDSNAIESAITDRTKAIMAVHIQGMPCDMAEIMKIAKKHNLFVIEDCAQAFGSTYKGKKVGTFGDAAAFSLQANKVITSGEGGIFVCKSDDGYVRAKMYHDNGGLRSGDDYPTWEAPVCSFGENYKITELQSAVAIEQLKKAPVIIAKQKELFDYFMSKAEQSNFTFRKMIPETECIHVSICILFDTVEKTETFIDYVNQHGVVFEKYCDKVLPLFNTFKNCKSWHSSGYPYNLTDYKVNSCEKTEKLADSSVWMALSPRLERADIDTIWDVLNAFQA